MHQNDKHKFKIYLEKKKFTTKTIKHVESSILHYKDWLKVSNKEIEKTKYKDILNYIGNLQETNNSKININKKLLHINHYYNYKKVPNPTIGIRLLGEPRKKALPIKAEELDKIYELYTPTPRGICSQPEKLILSLIIYQAATKQSLLNIKLSDINLERGEIRLREIGRHIQERELKLKSKQILPFNHYINNIRQKYNDKLFTRTCATDYQLEYQLKKLIKRLKKQSKKEGIDIKNISHLIQSRYCIWLKKYGIRQSQYMAGFKNPISIQAYEELDMEDLQINIEKYHPLNKID